MGGWLSVKHLPCEYKDLSFDFQDLYKKVGTVAPSGCGGRRIPGAHCSAGQAELTSSRFCKRLHCKNMVEGSVGKVVAL